MIVTIKNSVKDTVDNIKLTVRRVEADAWYDLGFYKYHYLTASLNKSCKCLLFQWNDVPVAFVALLNTPRKGMPYGFSISRIVILPDFQGLGLFKKIINFCGGIITNQGENHHLYIKTVHHNAGHSLEKITYGNQQVIMEKSVKMLHLNKVNIITD